MSNIRTPNIPGFIPHTRAPQTRFPKGATDCHAHVFGPQERFAYLPGAAYIPPDAVTTDYVAMLKNNGCDRGVLVQPSVYGTDNSCMVDALRSGLYALRGIAVVAANVTDRELEDLHAAGVRGVRINLASETEGLTLDRWRAAGAPTERARMASAVLSGSAENAWKQNHGSPNCKSTSSLITSHAARPQTVSMRRHSRHCAGWFSATTAGPKSWARISCQRMHRCLRMSHRWPDHW